MKIATVCVTHAPMNGGTKHQVYLAKELIKMGHEFHFYLKNPQRPSWINTNGIHYHGLDDLYISSGDILICNWHVVSDQLKDDRVKSKWGKRVLIIHDTPTANNTNNCLGGDHVLMGVSPTLLSIATGIHRVEDRVSPLYVHTGADPSFFNGSGRNNNDTGDLVLGVVGKSGERNVEYRGIDESIAIINGLKNRIPNITSHVFTGNSEIEMAKNYKKCHFLFELPMLAGCPTCVIESMSCRTPTIATYHGSTHLIDNDINGYILPKKNVQYCVDYLADKINFDNFKRLQSNIKYEDLSWRKLADKFLKNIDYS